MLLRKGNSWIAIGIKKYLRRCLVIERLFNYGQDMQYWTPFVGSKLRANDFATNHSKNRILNEGWLIGEPTLFHDAFPNFDPFYGMEPLSGSAIEPVISADRIRRNRRAKDDKLIEAARAAAEKAKLEAEKAEAEAVMEFQRRRYEKRNPPMQAPHPLANETIKNKPEQETDVYLDGIVKRAKNLELD